LILALGFLNLIIQPMGYKPEIVLLRIFYVFLVFILGCFIYRLGCLGGGDIKLIASLSIWFTPNNLVTFLILMTMFGVFLAGLSILYNQIVVLSTSKLLAHKKITTLPYGIAITASATILLI
jgi:prepilin peptidase CpaA